MIERSPGMYYYSCPNHAHIDAATHCAEAFKMASEATSSPSQTSAYQTSRCSFDSLSAAVVLIGLRAFIALSMSTQKMHKAELSEFTIDAPVKAL